MPAEICGTFDDGPTHTQSRTRVVDESSEVGTGDVRVTCPFVHASSRWLLMLMRELSTPLLPSTSSASARVMPMTLGIVPGASDAKKTVTVLPFFAVSPDRGSVRITWFCLTVELG